MFYEKSLTSIFWFNFWITLITYVYILIWIIFLKLHYLALIIYWMLVNFTLYTSLNWIFIIFTLYFYDMLRMDPHALIFEKRLFKKCILFGYCSVFFFKQLVWEFHKNRIQEHDSKRLQRLKQSKRTKIWE